MNNRPYKLEACVETLEQAIEAERNGADQIELCSHLELDGLSPSEELITTVLNKISIPVKVLIRSREGNFIYSKEEIKLMSEQIAHCKNVGVHGVVIGALNKKQELDFLQIEKLIEMAQPMKVSMHKCIDECANVLEAIEGLKKLGIITSILSSGGSLTAIQGSNILLKMMQLCGNEIEIIPAGKITQQNIHQIHALLNAKTYHGRNILNSQQSIEF